MEWIMERRRIACGLVLVSSVWMGWATRVAAETPVNRSTATAVRPSVPALDAAAHEAKYRFIFFWKENDKQTQTMYGVFRSATGKLGDSVDAVAVSVTDPRQRALVEQYDVSRAPMPLVLAVAPNGAVTRGLPSQFSEQDLQQAIVSPCTAQCLKAAQERKMVCLCVQNQHTRDAHAALQAAADLQADPRFAASTEVVTLDPSDARESQLLQTLQISPRTTQAVTVVLAPGGQTVARFAGPVTKTALVAKITAPQSSCCPGGQCGPGGCGPRK